MHYKKDKNFQSILTLFFSFFAFYGFYKNGFNYYLIGKMSLFASLRPLLFPIIGVLIVLGIESIKRKKLSINSNNIILGIFLGLFMPVEFPIVWYVILCSCFLLIYDILKKKMPVISWLCIFKCIVIMITHIFHIGLENQVEKTTPYLYGTLDVFFGKSVGTIGTTSFLLIVLLYLFLAANDFYYKKELPLYTYLSFLILFFCDFLFFQNNLQIKDAMNSSVLFMAVCLVPINENSPVSTTFQRIYGIAIGLLSFVFIHILNLTEGAYISLCLINILWTIFYMIWTKKIKVNV